MLANKDPARGTEPPQMFLGKSSGKGTMNLDLPHDNFNKKLEDGAGGAAGGAAAGAGGSAAASGQNRSEALRPKAPRARHTNGPSAGCS